MSKKSTYISIHDLKVDESFLNFINTEVLPELDISKEKFWQGVSDVFIRLAPINKDLLQKRADLQQKIDIFYSEKGTAASFQESEAFLHEIGYLCEEGEDFTITTQNIDDEISIIASPQLVVPISNARFALNAANARWGSLYDALYGTDAISENDGCGKSNSFNPKRGKKVILWVRDFFDEILPLSHSSWHNVTVFKINGSELIIETDKGQSTRLKNQVSFVGYKGNVESPSAVLLKHNDLHIEIQIDSSSPIGEMDKANIHDVILESAVSTIMDLEDSVAVVNAEDKIACYKNWLGLIKGDLKEEITKNGKTFTRQLNPDRHYISKNGEPIKLHGRSLMFIRNVGHLMTTPIMLFKDGSEVPEGILDGIFTSLISLMDINKQPNADIRNSRKNSIYIVKPKMHGVEEVEFSNTLFNEVEDLLQLERNTLKIGVMEEERRTSTNLKECIRAVKERIVFINTGFLDRTGDEIHTIMKGGAVVPKGVMKSTSWISAYEDRNVDIGLRCGFMGKAQIGKGMWAIPDNMADMLVQKIAHPKAGANCAWVPSPTAATLHATHYHRVYVNDVQETLKSRTIAPLENLLTPPFEKNTNWSPEDIRKELENNAQGLLGYMVRWVEHGVGCSKVPDINDIGLMEDRATLRISSQHLTNWLYHDICSKDQIIETLKKMAFVVDKQNANDPNYKAMSDNFEESLAFQAALELVFKGTEQPSGYTEPVLHHYRKLYLEKLQ